jgi:hypothetical protein
MVQKTSPEKIRTIHRGEYHHDGKQFVKCILASTCRNNHSCYLYTYMMNAHVLQNQCDGECRCYTYNNHV